MLGFRSFLSRALGLAKTDAQSQQETNPVTAVEGALSCQQQSTPVPAPAATHKRSTGDEPIAECPIKIVTRSPRFKGRIIIFNDEGKGVPYPLTVSSKVRMCKASRTSKSTTKRAEHVSDSSSITSSASSTTLYSNDARSVSTSETERAADGPLASSTADSGASLAKVVQPDADPTPPANKVLDPEWIQKNIEDRDEFRRRAWSKKWTLLDHQLAYMDAQHRSTQPPKPRRGATARRAPSANQNQLKNPITYPH